MRYSNISISNVASTLKNILKFNSIRRVFVLKILKKEFLGNTSKFARYLPMQCIELLVAQRIAILQIQKPEFAPSYLL